MVRLNALFCFCNLCFKGNINDDLDFEYDDGADARYGCGATLVDEYWYFGGDNKVSSDIWTLHFEPQDIKPQMNGYSINSYAKCSFEDWSYTVNDL